MADQHDRAVFVISVAAELAGVHPQTLRIYEREGLVRPKRTTANARRYSERDIERLLQIKARRDLVPYSSAIVRYEHPSRYENA
jgi:predicted site-specific integrase-resolvase